jgi:hypothetical protein
LDLVEQVSRPTGYRPFERLPSDVAASSRGCPFSDANPAVTDTPYTWLDL